MGKTKKPDLPQGTLDMLILRPSRWARCTATAWARIQQLAEEHASRRGGRSTPPSTHRAEGLDRQRLGHVENNRRVVTIG